MEVTILSDGLNSESGKRFEYSFRELYDDRNEGRFIIYLRKENTKKILSKHIRKLPEAIETIRETFGKKTAEDVENIVRRLYNLKVIRVGFVGEREPYLLIGKGVVDTKDYHIEYGFIFDKPRISWYIDNEYDFTVRTTFDKKDSYPEPPSYLVELFKQPIVEYLNTEVFSKTS